MKVAIQGGLASFHHIAARNYFGPEVEPVCCQTFRELSSKLQKGEVDFALMAIENAIAGSILPNYALMKEFDLWIIGEIHLRIEMNLIVMPGVKIAQLKKVRSHYMALSQCTEFLDQHPHIKLEEYHDTADSARDIKATSELEIGAIAGRYAAELYGMDIIAEGIENDKQNFTRFMVLTRDKKVKVEGSTKATLSFELPNTVGSLANMLKIIVDNHINLTKIQSLPILGRPSEYTFYVDCEWNNYDDFKRCVQLNSIVNKLKILGEYKKGETIYDHTGGR